MSSKCHRFSRIDPRDRVNASQCLYMFYHHSSKRLEARIHEEDRQRPFYFMKKMYRILGRRETEEKAVEVNEEKDEECYTIIRRFYWTKLVVEQRRFLWLLTRSCYLVRTRVDCSVEGGSRFILLRKNLVVTGHYLELRRWGN